MVAPALRKASMDTRFPTNLPNAPIDMRPVDLHYDDYAGNPTHRFFQMWQEIDCDAKKSSRQNPSGCQNDLFPWVEVNVGPGWNGSPKPDSFNDQTTHEGATAMQFLNVAKGDLPLLRAARPAVHSPSDNFHQAIQGRHGREPHHARLWQPDLLRRPRWQAGDPARRTDRKSQSGRRHQQLVLAGRHYGSTTTGGGGSYVSCADETQPGVKAIKTYLRSLPYKPFRDGDCGANEYYLVNN